MPNGWYPVEGLDVVLVNRTEQRYPRIDWDQSWDQLWAIELIGPRGFAPRGDLKFPEPVGPVTFERLVAGAHALIKADSTPHVGASLAFVDFKKKLGWAVGSFCAYGFKNGEVTALHDLSLGASIPKDVEYSGDPSVLSIQTTILDAEGLKVPPGMPEPHWQFAFEGVDSLVVSSGPLHYDAHWPPKTSLDCVVIALAKPDRRDALVALWQAPGSDPKGA